MTLPAQQIDSRARSLVLRCCAAWLLFFSAWLLLLITRGRGVPGLHGPRTLGNFLWVVGACFFGAAITAIIAAGVSVSKRRALSLRLRIVGLAPAMCMVLVIVVRIVVPLVVEWGAHMYHNWLLAP